MWAQLTVALGDHQPAPESRETFCRVDGASRTRTGDLLGAIQALFQLSYSPRNVEGMRCSGPPRAARIRSRSHEFPQASDTNRVADCGRAGDRDRDLLRSAVLGIANRE